MSAFWLKVIACVIMLIDHIGVVFETPYVLRCIGRIAMPIFVYMIAQGCKYTKDINKYAIRLGIFAIISEVPFDLAFSQYMGHSFSVNYLFSTNVFFTLFLGAVCIAVYENLRNKRGGWIALVALAALKLAPVLFEEMFSQSAAYEIIAYFLYIAFCMVLSKLLKDAPEEEKSPARTFIALIAAAPIVVLGSVMDTDYGMWGAIFIVFFYFTKPENKVARTAAMFAVVFLEYAYPYVATMMSNSGIDPFAPPGMVIYYTPTLELFWYALMAVPLVYIYNDKPGPKVKWAFYAFYPVHIAALGIIAYLVNNASLF